ncbi:TetR family transcriptional regulator [Mycolicibacterium cosmeticum]|uniref:TetR family transcriptional regulator n=1 Tax=Mycolicibacterium cosmeticum TaxID=258533 RepID=W9ASE3_MYCCO|nr:TetR/AcrR family transcriptional regulator [Mycolicibacterium cosmeticum]TLH68863.1 TetR family transcriptional regulator [Mycolicibacterium cosmeticum]CDO05526.1 TetR family transcriptional regulator [Mycolicibacterium cosmeticum]
MTSTAGRPRDPAKDAAVLRATRELLVEAGYQGTTMVAIAKRAGVGAPTLYRRWPTKEALVEDAAFGHPSPAPLPAATGDVYTDLRTWVALFLDWLANPVTRAALPGLLTAYHRDESIYKRLVLRAEADVRALMAELLGGDAERADTVFDFLVATTVVRAMTRGLADREAFCDRTAAALTALARA